MGYLLNGTSYQGQNFPGSMQTQVTGLNDDGVTVGFWSGMNNANLANDNHRFVDVNGRFRNQIFISLSFPGASSMMALGVSNRDEVVGAYTDGFLATPQR